jgi:hypothetical protein
VRSVVHLVPVRQIDEPPQNRTGAPYSMMRRAV